jgi:outer membrane murein-binding lipoprotein Lpp
MFNSLEGSVQTLNSKIIQLEGESEYYKSQAQRGSGTPEDAYYFL